MDYIEENLVKFEETFYLKFAGVTGTQNICAPSFAGSVCFVCLDWYLYDRDRRQARLQLGHTESDVTYT